MNITEAVAYLTPHHLTGDGACIGLTAGKMHEAMNAINARHVALEALALELAKGCDAACGYLLNAKIDLETGAPKRTAIGTIEGGLKTVRAALSSPLLAELRARETGR